MNKADDHNSQQILNRKMINEFGSKYRTYPDKPALIFEGQSFTYRELNEMSNRIANGLSALGISCGDRVALFLPNIPAFVTVSLGIQKIGAVPVAINSALKAEEVKYIIEDSGALILITTEVLRANIPVEEIFQLKYILIAEGEAKTDRALSERWLLIWLQMTRLLFCIHQVPPVFRKGR